MRDNLISHAASGALGGAIGTGILLQGMKASRKLPERLKPTQVRMDPGEFMVSKVEELRGKPLPRTVRDVLARGMHWGYGTTSGALLGIVTSRLHLRTIPSALLAGPALGTAVWATGYAVWLPAAKLAPPLPRQGGRHVAISILGHVVFGVISAIPVLLLDRSARAEPWWKRAWRSVTR
jgi:hypothetical protein